MKMKPKKGLNLIFGFFIQFAIFIGATSIGERYYNITVNPKYQLVKQYGEAFLNCETFRIQPHKLNHTDMEWRWYPEINSPDRGIDVADIGKLNTVDICKENIECMKCNVEKEHGELNLRLRNVTWVDRGTYQCIVMAEAIEDIRLEVAVIPDKVNCFLDDEAKNSKTLTAHCFITCTFPKPNITLREDEYSIISGTEEEVINCTGKQEGMKEYHIIYKFRTRISVTIFGIDYNEKFFLKKEPPQAKLKTVEQNQTTTFECQTFWNSEEDRNDTNMEWRWISEERSENQKKEIVLAKMTELNGFEIPNENKVKCFRCSMVKSNGQFDIRLKNIQWNDRGCYQCSQMGDIIENVQMQVVVKPGYLNCSLEDNKGIFLTVKCSIGCTFPQPNISLTGDNYKIVTGIENGGINCTGTDYGMQRYDLQFGFSYNSKLNIKISGIGYNYENLFEEQYSLEFYDYFFIIAPLLSTVFAILHVCCYHDVIDRVIDQRIFPR